MAGAKANYFKIGVFVISAILIAILVIVVLGAGSLFTREFLVETYFRESVQGLEEGSPLKLRGVKIGKVQEISLVGTEYQTGKHYILVRATVARDTFRTEPGESMEAVIGSEVLKGLRARLTYQGITGAAHLSLDYVSQDSAPLLKYPWKPKYVYIPSTPSTITRISVAVDRIMRSLEKTDFQQFTRSLEGFLNTVTKSLEGTDLGSLTQEAKALLTELRANNRRLSDLLNAPQVDAILPDTARAVSAARRITEGAEQPVAKGAERFAKVSENMVEFSGKLNTLTASLAEDMKALQKVLRRFEQLYSSHEEDIGVSIENIRVVTENLKEFSNNIKKAPSELFFGKPPKRMEPVRK